MRIKDKNIRISIQEPEPLPPEPLAHANYFIKKYVKKKGLRLPVLTVVKNRLLSFRDSGIIAVWVSTEGIVSITFFESPRIKYKCFFERFKLHSEGDLVIDYSLEKYKINFLLGSIKEVG